MIGSLGFGSATGLATGFDSAAGDFLGADDSVDVGLGAVMDGNGGDATADDELPINGKKTFQIKSIIFQELYA